MKKILMAFLILAAGAIAFGKLHHARTQALLSAERQQAEWIELTNELWASSAKANALDAEVKTAKLFLEQASPGGAPNQGLQDWDKGDSSKWPWAVRAALRDYLGLAWDNSPDYVLVSKASFKDIYVNGVDQHGSLHLTARTLLAITPEERSAIESSLAKLETEHAAWVKTNVVRVQPSGNIVARYVIPANAEHAERLKQEGMQTAFAALGSERATLFREYAGAWLFGHGNLGANDISLTVRRYGEGPQQKLRVEFAAEAGNGPHNSGVSDLTPGPLPDLFKDAFPGGWRELAQREGFQLPAQFGEESKP